MIDRVFAQLSSADIDFIASMETLGRALTGEARAIDNLQFANQKSVSDTGVISSKKQIESLHSREGEARRKLQTIQAELGYATREGMTVAIHHESYSVTLNGNVHISSIIVGRQIQDVDVMINESAVEPKMKAVLKDLNAALLERHAYPTLKRTSPFETPLTSLRRQHRVPVARQSGVVKLGTYSRPPCASLMWVIQSRARE